MIVTYDQDTQALWVIELRDSAGRDWSSIRKRFRGEEK